MAQEGDVEQSQQSYTDGAGNQRGYCDLTAYFGMPIEGQAEKIGGGKDGKRRFIVRKKPRCQQECRQRQIARRGHGTLTQPLENQNHTDCHQDHHALVLHDPRKANVVAINHKQPGSNKPSKGAKETPTKQPDRKESCETGNGKGQAGSGLRQMIAQ